MKIYCSLLLVLIFTSCASSQTLSINEYGRQVCATGSATVEFDRVEDVNNTFDKFLGTWQTIHQGNTIELFFYKIIATFDETDYDTLVVKSKVLNSTGAVLFDTVGYPIDSPKLIQSLYLCPNGNFIFMFVGEGLCQASGDIRMLPLPDSMSRTTTFSTMEFEFMLSPDMKPEECATVVAEYPFPRDTTIVFTKM